jgi:hypothetical protein
VKAQMLLFGIQLFVLFAEIGLVHAADESPLDQFLGSPLLILVALIVIAALAALYHRIRK